jgi:hypothetical protein
VISEVPHRAYFLKIALRCIPAASLTYAIIPSAAVAETTSDFSVSASTGYDTNPFSGVDNNREVASFRLEVAPSLTYSDGASEIRIESRIEHVEYLGKFDSAQNLSTSIAAQHRVNERTTITANFGLASTKSQSDFVGLPGFPGQSSNPDQPLNPGLPDVLVDDISLLGREIRRTSVTAGGSIVYRPSPFDEVEFSSDLNFQRYPKNSGLNDYDYGSQRLSYSRALDESISVGGLLEYGVGDFKYIRFGDATILSPQFMIKARLNGQFEFNSSLGASFTSVNTPLGKSNVTALSGTGSLCYRGARDNFCVNGQRQTLPTAVGGVRTITSVGTSYALNLSSRDSFQSGTSFSKASTPITGGTSNFESIRIFGRLERSLNERARIFVLGAYSNSSDELFESRSNIQAQLGITIRYGKR